MYRVPEDVDETAAAAANCALSQVLNGPDAIEVTGVSAAIDEGFQLLGNGGRYLVMGNIIPEKEATIDPGKAVRKSIEMTTMMRCAPWYLQEALEFLSEHGDDYPFGELVDAEYPLAEMQDAIRDSANRAVTRAALIPE